MERTFRAFALCALGIEKVLQAEIERLGLATAGRAPGRVYFDADLAGLFRANLCLRTAERVLIEAARFKAPDFDALFDKARGVSWEDYIGRQDKLVIERVRIRDSQLSAQTSVQSVIHKAIYERLGEVYKLERMPESGGERSARVYLEEDECLIGLDTSGDALHKRGYRRSLVDAPIKETLAAAALFLTGWNRRIPLMDLFCGSGTILIEAGLFGLDIAPGLGRSFAMEEMPLADASVFEAERAAAKARIRTDVDLVLMGSDVDRAAIDAARLNARLAGLESVIVVKEGAAEKAEAFETPGYVISNPPYGNRLGTEAEAEELYRRIGLLAPRFKGWGLCFITNRQDFGSFFGRRATAEHKLLNGAEEQWIHWFPPGYEDTKPREPVQMVPQEEREARPARMDARPRSDSREGRDGRGSQRRPAERFPSRSGSRDAGHRDAPYRGPDHGSDRGGYRGAPDRSPDRGGYRGADHRDAGHRDAPYRSPDHSTDRGGYRGAPDRSPDRGGYRGAGPRDAGHRDAPYRSPDHSTDRGGYRGAPDRSPDRGGYRGTPDRGSDHRDAPYRSPDHRTDRGDYRGAPDRSPDRGGYRGTSDHGSGPRDTGRREGYQGRHIVPREGGSREGSASKTNTPPRVPPRSPGSPLLRKGPYSRPDGDRDD
jgi:putative N6-adenine-specific DNA methylase